MWSPNHLVPVLPAPNNTAAMPIIVDGDGYCSRDHNTKDSINNIQMHTPPVAYSPKSRDNADIFVPRETSTPARESGIQVQLPPETHNTADGSLPGCFMDSHQVIGVIVSHVPTTSALPNGRKKNLFFVVNNAVKIGHRTASQPRNFADDCGVWDHQKSSTKKHAFLMTNDGEVVC